jgi:hypothetical protein
VTERRFALFPQKSGLLVIDPITLTVSVPADPARVRGFFSPTRKLTRRTDAIRLEVQARPSSGSPWWLPASAVTLDSEWAGGTDRAIVDQPLTRSINLRAGGVMDTQLPDISLPAIDGASLYAEEPTRAMGMNQRGLVAEQTIKWALIPQREGELVLPAITVQWFNTDTGRFETAALPAETLQVGPADESAYARSADAVRDGGAAAASAAGSANGTGTGSGNGSGNRSAAAASRPDADATSLGNASDAGSTLGASDADGAASRTASAAGLIDDAARVGGAGSGALGGTVAPAAGALTVADSAAAGRLSALQRSVDWWRTAALGLLALWLITVIIYLVKRAAGAHRDARERRDIAEQGAVASGMGAVRQRAGRAYLKLAPLASVEVACNSTDPTAVRKSLLEWATRQWPAYPPRTLTELAARLTDASTRGLIRDLDASLYSRPRNPADAAALMSRLTGLPEQLQSAISEGQFLPAEDEDVDDSGARGAGSRGKGLPAL